MYINSKECVDLIRLVKIITNTDHQDELNKNKIGNKFSGKAILIKPKVPKQSSECMAGN